VILYGQPVTLAGERTACTELRRDESGRWGCWVIDGNSTHVPVVALKPYSGPCAHLSADQVNARWQCLGNDPVPVGQLPTVRDPRAGIST
jgi:hypothetical protein